MIASRGYETAFLWFGIGQGVIVFLMSFVLRPAVGGGPVQKRKLKVQQAQFDRTPAEMVRTPVFWVMYAMFVMVASGGLMTAAQIGPIAHDYQIANVPLNLFGLQMAALILAISLDRVLDGFGRPFFGWVSDNIGRENTMFIAFATAAVALTVMSTYGREPWIFVLFTALFFAVFGEIYSLFPATCGDTFGSKYAATNAGLLYTAKGAAALSGSVCELGCGRLRLECGVHDRGGPERDGGSLLVFYRGTALGWTSLIALARTLDLSWRQAELMFMPAATSSARSRPRRSRRASRGVRHPALKHQGAAARSPHTRHWRSDRSHAEQAETPSRSQLHPQVHRDAGVECRSAGLGCRGRSLS